jgi:hypothetical protein
MLEPGTTREGRALATQTCVILGNMLEERAPILNYRGPASGPLAAPISLKWIMLQSGGPYLLGLYIGS